MDRTRLSIILVFLGVFTAYEALSPATISGMGYTAEEMVSGNSMLANLHARWTGQPRAPVKWSRHGPLAVVLDLPIQLIGKVTISDDFLLSFVPVTETALLIIVLFLWLIRLTSPGMALFLTLAGAFATMLWPYAYIGLETKQSLFLMLAGYLALTGGPIRTVSKSILFGFCCAVAISVKSTSIVLAPAILYLISVQFYKDWRTRYHLAATTVAIVVGVAALNAILRGQYWLAGGVTSWIQLKTLLNYDFFTYLGSLIGAFGSPTKGLVLFAPPVLAAFFAFPEAWRSHYRVACFVALAVGGTVFGFAGLRFFADEVWGPRYLHSCVAPLLLVLGAAREKFEIRRDAVLLPLAALGLTISFLGAFFYYGNVLAAAGAAHDNTEEEILGNTEFNAVSFHARLFAIWWNRTPGPVLWVPEHHWMWTAPPGAPPPRVSTLGFGPNPSRCFYVTGILRGTDGSAHSGRYCFSARLSGPRPWGSPVCAFGTARPLRNPSCRGWPASGGHAASWRIPIFLSCRM